jgi:precorrin-6y C5,15-methyltransferase (decarboxylating) CbiE subunit
MIVSVGIGPGNLEYLTRRGEKLIAGAEVIAGFQAVLDYAARVFPEDAEVVPLTYRNQTEELARTAARHHEGKRCVVLFMGDPHFSGWQMHERVEKACGHPVETVPGISSAQVMASRAGVCFDETTFVTFHRRGDLEPFKKHLVRVLEDGRNAIVIPHPWDFMPDRIAAHLIAAGIDPGLAMEVWENLTADEACWKGRLGDCPGGFSDMSIVMIRARRPFPGLWDGEQSVEANGKREQT